MLPLRIFTTFTSPKLNVLFIPILSTLCRVNKMMVVICLFLFPVSQPPFPPIQFAFEVRLVTADLLATLDFKITKKPVLFQTF